MFSRVVNSASTEELIYEGDLIFDDTGTLTASFMETKGFAAVSSKGDMVIGLMKSSNDGYVPHSNEYVAETFVHELFHTGGVNHLTDSESPLDARLQHVPGTPIMVNGELIERTFFRTTEETNKSILNNVMLDNHVNVNDKLVREHRNKLDFTGANTSTESQIKVIINSIDRGAVNGEANPN